MQLFYCLRLDGIRQTYLFLAWKQALAALKNSRYHPRNLP
jgi:hypothetical protein